MSNLQLEIEKRQAEIRELRKKQRDAERREKDRRMRMLMKLVEDGVEDNGLETSVGHLDKTVCHALLAAVDAAIQRDSEERSQRRREAVHRKQAEAESRGEYHGDFG